MAEGKKRFCAVALAFAAALGILARPAAAGDQAPLVLQLPGEAPFEFAGYYAALWQDFYRDAGLDVEIRPGSAAVDPVREVVEGPARFGVGDARLLVRIAQGLPLLLLAPIFQESAAAVYYRADQDFPWLASLRDARIGRPALGSALDLEFRATLHAAGIDPERLKAVSVEPGGMLDALAARRIDAAVGSAWEIPWRAHVRGMAIEALALPGQFYGDTLFASQHFAAEEPGLVEAFRAASIKGWDYALAHPDQVVARLAARARDPASAADSAAFARYQSEIARRLAHYRNTEVGRSEPQRWRQIGQTLVEIGAIQHPPDLAAAIYDPSRAVSEGIARPLAVVAGAGIVAAGGFLWRRQRRRAAQLAPGPADLDAMLTALEPKLRRRLPKRLGFRLSLPSEKRLCEADPGALRGMVIGLAREAADEMAGEGEIIIGTRDQTIEDTAELPGAVPGRYVRLTVKDNGPGLSPDLLDEVFDPENTVRPMALRARALALRLGGFALVESAEGIGTAVHLYFRREAAADDGRRQPSGEEPLAKAA